MKTVNMILAWAFRPFHPRNCKPSLKQVSFFPFHLYPPTIASLLQSLSFINTPHSLYSLFPFFDSVSLVSLLLSIWFAPGGKELVLITRTHRVTTAQQRTVVSASNCPENEVTRPLVFFLFLLFLLCCFLTLPGRQRYAWADNISTYLATYPIAEQKSNIIIPIFLQKSACQEVY